MKAYVIINTCNDDDEDNGGIFSGKEEAEEVLNMLAEKHGPPNHFEIKGLELHEDKSIYQWTS